MNKFYCVKDEDGVLRPMAGIWRYDEAGKYSAEKYAQKDGWITIAVIEIKEIDE